MRKKTNEERERDKAIGDKLRMFRARNRYTQEQIGSAIGVEKNTIVGYERGSVSIKPEYLTILCEHFNLPTDYFIINDTIDKNINDTIIQNLDTINDSTMNKSIINENETMDYQMMGRMMALLETQTKNVTDMVRANTVLSDSMKTIAFEIMHLNQHFHADTALGEEKIPGKAAG